MAILKGSKGKPIAILNREKHVRYLVSAKTYEKMLDILEDYELCEIVRKRQNKIKKNSRLKSTKVALKKVGLAYTNHYLKMVTLTLLKMQMNFYL